MRESRSKGIVLWWSMFSLLYTYACFQLCY